MFSGVIGRTPLVSGPISERMEREMIRLIALFVAAVLAGCAGNNMPLATGSLGSEEGALSIRQEESGRRVFHYAIMSGLSAGVASQDHQESIRKSALARDIASRRACPGAYSINNRYEASGMVIYEGACA